MEGLRQNIEIFEITQILSLGNTNLSNDVLNNERLRRAIESKELEAYEIIMDEFEGQPITRARLKMDQNGSIKYAKDNQQNQNDEDNEGMEEFTQCDKKKSVDKFLRIQNIFCQYLPNNFSGIPKELGNVSNEIYFYPSS